MRSCSVRDRSSAVASNCTFAVSALMSGCVVWAHHAYTLHWLHIVQRIQYKIAKMAFNQGQIHGGKRWGRRGHNPPQMAAGQKNRHTRPIKSRFYRPVSYNVVSFTHFLVGTNLALPSFVRRATAISQTRSAAFSLLHVKRAKNCKKNSAHKANKWPL